MSYLTPKIKAWDLKILRAYPPSKRYLIGVSGGRDSVALLHFLISCGYRKLIVCHLDHKLRGAAGRKDARFVERLARNAGQEFEGGNVDVGALATRTKQSIETAGRMARYEFFAGVAKRRRCHTIFLAHHADDLVETFLMNLFRGAGVVGLSGMREIVSRKVGSVKMEIVRPLLGVWREEIDAYVKAQRVTFREDASNESLEPVRNRIRHRVIPQIEKQLGRKVRASIWRAATIAADESAWLGESLDPKQSEAKELAVEALRAQSRAQQRRTIHGWLQARGIADLDFDLIERVRALLDPAAKTAKTNLPRGLHVRRRAKKIFIDQMPPDRRAET